MSDPHVEKFVLLVLSVPEVPDELTDVLCTHLGLNQIDARIRLHDLPGIVPDRIPADVADQLIESIHDKGGLAVKIEADEIPKLTHPQAIHHAACTENGFQIFDLDGQLAETIPWTDLELLSIGVLPTQTTHHEVPDSTAIHSAPGPRGRGIDMAVMRGAVAWLIAANPLRVFKIVHNELNYEYLDDRMTQSSATNFRLFADDIIARARQLFLTPATRAFTNHGLFHHYAFESEESLREHTLFHLLICRKIHEQNR